MIYAIIEIAYQVFKQRIPYEYYLLIKYKSISQFQLNT